MNDDGIPRKRPFVIGIAGGSGSGKTTLARALAAAAPSQVALIQQDSYYRDQSHLRPEERDRINFDHPDTIELGLLTVHLDALRAGRSIDKPVYDFAAHVRRDETQPVAPRPVIVVEGIMVLADAALRARMDLRVFVDTDPDVRVLRRIARDIDERGRTFEQVEQQYQDTVRPMHVAFVEPSKRHAHVIIPEGGENDVALSLIVGRVREVIRDDGVDDDA